jgi:predicted nucleic acid-binding protein
MLLDSNILIGYLNGDERITAMIDAWALEDRVLCISTITYAEVLSHPALTHADIAQIRGFLQRFVVLPFDDSIADNSAELRRRYHITLPDAGIIATALTHHLPLVTRDKLLHKVTEVTFVTL